MTTQSILMEPNPVVLVDVDYRPTEAVAVALVAASWDAPIACEIQIARIADVKPYEPGAFYKRELPCILDVLARVQSAYRAIVVDGYVDLDASGTPGLGGHLHNHLQKNIAVIGIAKTAFHGSSFAVAVRRGTSQKPLFVTGRGIKYEHAAHLVQRMHGAYRLPSLVKEVDRLARRS